MPDQGLTKPDAETGASAASPAPPTQPPTILVVEDEALVRDILMKVLRRAGYRVLPAANGQEAIRALDLPGINLIITDLYMPQMDGLELVMQLRRKYRTIPVIAISGSVSEQNADMLRTVRLLGARLTLAKPFSMHELVAAVNHLLGAPAPDVVP